MIMGFSVGGPEAVRLAHPPHVAVAGGVSGGGKTGGRAHSGSLSSVEEIKREGYDF